MEIVLYQVRKSLKIYIDVNLSKVSKSGDMFLKRVMIKGYVRK